MKIADLPVATSYDESCYMPISINGATYKTKVENVTPNVANNLTTMNEGFVLDARQGKALKDAIDLNASAIAVSDGLVQTGVVVDEDPWVLYDSRSDNSTELHFPRNSREVLLSLKCNGTIYNTIIVNGIIEEEFNIFIGGYYTYSSYTYYRDYFYATVYPETRAISPIKGTYNDSTISVSTNGLSCQVWYR